MDRIVVHHCCAECSPKIIEFFRNKNFKIFSLWYNPNIHLEEEYNRRLEALKRLIEMENETLSVIEDYFSPEYWREKVAESNDRCKVCYSIRLEKTAEFAKQNETKYFTTTLLISPHQKHDLIKEIGRKIAERKNLIFYYLDLRDAFYEGKRIVKQLNLYTQKYCGCVLSIK